MSLSDLCYIYVKYEFTATTVVMSNKDKFPLGRSKGKGIKEAYARYRIAQFNERG
ncbi:hypothetical protein ABND28_21635 [Paenibacillus larvae]